MIRLLRFLLLSMMLFPLLSCTPGPPYEIKSPCVSAESLEISAAKGNPCIRRLVNRDII